MRLDVFLKPLLIFAHLEEIRFLVRALKRPSAVGADPVRRLSVRKERLAGNTVEPFVFALINIALIVELFKYLLKVQCNALYDILPKMFSKLEDYTELLLPDYLLREGSVIEKLVNEIPEDNFDVNTENGQIEIIGWMY